MINSGIFGGEDENKVHWFCLARAFSKEEIKSGKAGEVLELMKKAGCSKIGIGVEAFNPRDIINLKRPTGETDASKLFREGVEKYTNAVWSLKQASNRGIFTRGYFVWGRENQDSLAESRARALLELEIPRELFEDYDRLSQAIEFIFKKQNELTENGGTFTAEELASLVAQEFGLENSARERFLEIDHIRISPETPYPKTALGRTAKLRYRDNDGEVVETDKTLSELIEEGWDEWDVLDQESPVLQASIGMSEIEDSQQRLVRDFYLSDSYAESVKRKLDKFPHLEEAYRDWAEFWRENGIPVEFEKWQIQNDEAKGEKTET